MIRKLLLLATVVLGCSAIPAYGLGLGELELDSALNQQFSAEIELTNVRGLEIDEILPNLASQEDFDRVGVERNYLLTDLRFRVEANEGGDLVIVVTSSKPIIEPFLNFIVEVLWPTGRILREYTVLLDPPVFGEQGIEAVQPSQVTRQQPTAPVPARPSSQAVAPSTAASPPRTQPQSAPAESQPEPASEVGGVDGDEYGMTGQGDTLWNIALKVRPSNAVTVQQTMLALQRANPEAFINNNINLLKAGYVLRIPDVREIREESVNSAVAEVRTQNREFDDYKGGSLAQLDATRRQPEARDRGENRGSGELKLLSSEESAANGAGSNARTQELENELAVAEEDLDRARRANAELNTKVDDIQGQLDTLNEILTLKDDQIAALRAEIQKSQNAAEQSTSTSASAPATQPAASGSFLSNPITLGGIGLLLVALVAGLLFFLKRRQQSDDDDDQIEEELAEQDLEPEDLDEDLDEEEVVEAALDEEEDITPETTDVISEVEIYIAYGRFPQAITFLQNAIEAEPDRADIQLKLLEVYVQTEDSIAFNLQLDQLRLLNDQAALEQALELQKKIPGAAEDAAAAMDATVISTEPVEAIMEPADDDDDLSFDLDDLDSETEDDDLDLGGDLDLDDDLGDDLDLSLDADDELDLDDSDIDKTVVLSDDELELSLDGADDELTLDLEDELGLDDEISLDLDDDISLDLDDDDIDENSDTIALDIEEVSEDADTIALAPEAAEEEISLDLDDLEDLEDELSLDLDDDGSLEDTLDLEDDLEDGLDSDDDVLDLSDLDDDDLDLEDELQAVSDTLDSTDDGLELDLDDDGLDLDLDDDGLSLDDDEISLDLDDKDEVSLDLDDEISLDLDDEISLDLDDDDPLSLDLDESDDISLDLDDDLSDDDLEIDLGDDLENDLDLDLDSDDDIFDLSDDDENSLDLARAYIDMGDAEGAKGLLEEILVSGTDAEKQEATDLLAKLS